MTRGFLLMLWLVVFLANARYLGDELLGREYGKAFLNGLGAAFCAAGFAHSIRRV